MVSQSHVVMKSIPWLHPGIRKNAWYLTLILRHETLQPITYASLHTLHTQVHNNVSLQAMPYYRHTSRFSYPQPLLLRTLHLPPLPTPPALCPTFPPFRSTTVLNIKKLIFSLAVNILIPVTKNSMTEK